MDVYSLFHLDSNRKINRKAGCAVKPIVQKEANQKAPLCKGSWAEGPEGLIAFKQFAPVTKGEGTAIPPPLRGTSLCTREAFSCAVKEIVWKEANSKALFITKAG